MKEEGGTFTIANVMCSYFYFTVLKFICIFMLNVADVTFGLRIKNAE